MDIFLSLCRFEWQAGYQELATALLQAEIEFSVFCPSLHLTEQSKQRLFEHFWISGGARVGEEGALGWSAWLEKEEEERQRAMKAQSAREDEKGGWTGWSKPLFKNAKTNEVAEDVHDASIEELNEEVEVEAEDLKQEDDTEALLKMLGIDADAEPNGEVKDTSTWVRWSQEESSRDHDQWMPIHSKSGLPLLNSLPSLPSRAILAIFLSYGGMLIFVSLYLSTILLLSLLLKINFIL